MPGTISTTFRAPHAQSGVINVALWVLQVVTAVAVVGAGLATVSGAAQAVEMFHQIGAGDWFRYLTGALEVAGGLGLLIPRLSGLAGLALVALWTGALGTHLFLIGGNPTPAVVFLVLSAVVAYGRRHGIAELMGGIVR